MAGGTDVTRILDAAARGDPSAAGELLPLVYDELRKLATRRLAQEKAGQTLQATALVHEGYLRLVGGAVPQHFNGRGHFFAAAAEAMRRILVENARRKNSLKAGGDRRRLELDGVELDALTGPDALDLVALDEALAKLEAAEPRKGELVKLRYFAGLTNDQAAEVLGVSSATAENDWAYARAWLRLQLGDGAE
jgi:RNA polymerase sigma factor (TIGR02999 family)